MNNIPIGELIANFSAILRRVKGGEKIVILNGKKKEKVAVLIPYVHLKPKKGRKLGLLKGKSGYAIKGDFQIREEAFLSF
jgi:antitoxin (DNA-binding transcriptional repressor) of toxin-antitoxin stability system